MSKTAPKHLSSSEDLIKKLFTGGELFRDASNILWSKGSVFPASVHASFAFELYLKCLITVDGNKAPAIHDLDKLFRMTGADSQREIRRSYKDALKSSDFQRHKAAWDCTGTAVDWKFDSMLKRSKDAFVTLRYFYEDPQKVAWLANPISEITRERILKLRPAFASL